MPAKPSPIVAARWWLAALGILSFGLVTTVNRAAGHIFPAWPWLPDTCIPSALVCLGLYIAIRPVRPFAGPKPTTNWRRVLRLSASWLVLWVAGSALAALLMGHWLRYRLAETPPQLLGFLLLAPIQEELLFRGAIFELAERSRLGAGPWPPVLLSTLCFSLHHLQLHGYALTPAALGQLGFTVPMGVVFGLLRAETDSLWPPLAVHILTNLPGAIGHRG